MLKVKCLHVVRSLILPVSSSERVEANCRRPLQDSSQPEMGSDGIRQRAVTAQGH